jgi:hypothetical protein
METNELEFINEETDFLLNSDFDSSADVDDIELYMTCAERCYYAFHVQLNQTPKRWESLSEEEVKAWAYVVLCCDTLLS